MSSTSEVADATFFSSGFSSATRTAFLTMTSILVHAVSALTILCTLVCTAASSRSFGFISAIMAFSTAERGIFSTTSSILARSSCRLAPSPVCSLNGKARDTAS